MPGSSFLGILHTFLLLSVWELIENKYQHEKFRKNRTNKQDEDHSGNEKNVLSHTYRQTGRQTDGQTHTEKQTNRQKDKWTDKRTDEEKDRQRDGRTDRQTESTAYSVQLINRPT